MGWQQITQGPTPNTDNTKAIAESDRADAQKQRASSMAVLPFADLSPEGDQEYFSDGIAEEILNVLVGVDGLDIVSRTSSFQFKDRDLGIRDIAATLGVRHIVEGSVRKSGGTIRVTAQLIDADADIHLWSETYDRPLDAENLFEIQDDIANSIVSALRETLGLVELEEITVMATTKSLTAYEMFLEARPLYQSRVDLGLVIELLQQAVAQDPSFAKAWEMLAATTNLLGDYGPTDDSIEILDVRAAEYANKALAIDPGSATAIAVLGLIDAGANESLRRPHKIGDTISTFSRALDIQPRNPEALNWRGLRYGMVGDLPAAIDDFERCLDYEPYYSPCSDNRYWALAVSGRDEEALEGFREGLSKGISKLYYTHWGLLARLGKEDLFKAAMNHPDILYGWPRHDDLYMAYQDLDADHRDLVASIRAFEKKTVRVDSLGIDTVVLPLGGFDQPPTHLSIWGESSRRYRQSAQFKDYADRAGIHEYWREYGFPPQCRPVGEDDFECD
jgi:TolB-like protein